MQTLLALAKQGLALSGYRNEQECYSYSEIRELPRGAPGNDKVIKGDENPGNFLHFLFFLERNMEMRVLTTLHERAKYTSPSIQNEFLNIRALHV